jgi:exodeoxyribonuclease-3
MRAIRINIIILQQKGYSGVAILSKIKPNHVVYGTGIDHMDFEGRNLL